MTDAISETVLALQKENEELRGQVQQSVETLSAAINLIETLSRSVDHPELSQMAGTYVTLCRSIFPIVDL